MFLFNFMGAIQVEYFFSPTKVNEFYTIEIARLKRTVFKIMVTIAVINDIGRYYQQFANVCIKIPAHLFIIISPYSNTHEC